MDNSFPKKDITFESTFMGFDILRSNNNDLGTYMSSMKKIIKEVDRMINKHNKILFTRFDIRVPQDVPIQDPKKCFTRIGESLKRDIVASTKNSPHDVDLIMFKSEEQTKESTNPHAHYFVMCNGNVIQNAYKITEAANRHAKRIFDTDKDGLVHRSNALGEKGLLARKDDKDFHKNVQKAVLSASYLSKVKGKQNTKKGTQRLTVSRSNNKSKNK